MTKIIAKKCYERAPDGTPVAYRTKYYHYFDGDKSRPILGSKQDAVRVNETEAEAILRQLNTLSSGFFALQPDESPQRDRKPPKAPQEAA